ncbi:hypothetical protein AB833_04255 [Chromatiales bacterium (ex Bugula neritina AB1)]|nr:hypothetical protein AB833_04255 [Chromatiales bacterium (ex Bugula neritina AB1)]
MGTVNTKSHVAKSRFKLLPIAARRFFTVVKDHRWWRMGKFSRDRSKTRVAPTVAEQQPVIEILEPWVLYSADPFGLAIDSPQVLPESIALPLPTDAPVISPIVSADQWSTAAQRELVLINDNIGDIDTLISDLRQQAHNGRELQVYLLSSEESGLEQISAILANQQSVATLHIVSHGNDSGLQLGGSWLDATTLSHHEGLIGAWQPQFKESASIQLYGCDLAASSSGVSLLETLASLTGTSIAASDDSTGHQALQADWDLEYSTRSVAAAALLSDAAQQDWLDELATLTFRNGDSSGYSQTVDTTLSELAESQDQGDTVNLRTSDLSGNATQTLIRFDDFIGTDAKRIAPGSTISSATLTLEISNPAQAGSTATVHTLLQGWDEHASWEQFGAGVQANDIEAASLPATQFHTDSSGTVNIDVTASVQSWLNGAINHGWLITSSATGSELHIHSSEALNDALRPQLTIIYSTPLVVTTTDDSIDAPVTSSISQLQANPGADGEITLREAIIAANNTNGSHEIILPGGKYTLSEMGNSAIAGDLDIFIDLTIRGAGAGVTVIDASNISDRHFDIHNSSSLQLHDLTLSGGSSSHGGSVFVGSDATLRVTDSAFSDNTSTDTGGAIHSLGTLSLLDSELKSNSAGNSDGGAIYATGNASIEKSTLVENSANDGAAIMFSGSTLNVSRSDIHSNQATQFGGAIRADSGTVTITQSSLHKNTASEGGAVYVDSGTTLNILRSTVSTNTASDDGGGIRARDSGTSINIESSTIAFNESTGGDGGGINNRNGGVATNITNSVFEANTVSGSVSENFSNSSNLNSGGYNHDSDGTSGFKDTGDVLDESALLKPLTYISDSSIAEHPLQANSPARDSGDPAATDPDSNNHARVGIPDRGASESFAHSITRVADAPAIDGAIDILWSSADPADLLDHSGDVSTPPSFPGGSWKAVWDSNSLYLLVEVSDDTPHDDSLSIWHDDSIAVYLDPDNSRQNSYDGVDDTKFYSERTSNTIVMGSNPLALTGLEIGTNNTATGYTKEIAIPWNQLGIVPSDGLNFGIEVHLNDDANGGSTDTELTWADSADVAWTNPAAFGAAHLLDNGLDSAPSALNHGITINSDGGNNRYFEAPASLTTGLGDHTIQTRFSTDSASGLLVFPWIDNTQISTTLSPIIADNQPHTHTWVWDSATGTGTTYIDGQLALQQQDNSHIGKSVTSTAPLIIGQVLGNSGQLDPTKSYAGTIYDVRLWDRVLSTEEVDDNLVRQFSPDSPPADLLANWRFNRLAGDNNDRVVDLVNPGDNDIIVKSVNPTSNWVTSIADDQLNIDDNTTAGDTIGNFFPTDSQTTERLYNYVLLNNHNGLFTIDSDKGQLRIASGQTPAEEINTTQYPITVRLFDDSGNQFDRHVNVQRIAQNEAPLLTGFPVNDPVFVSNGTPVLIGPNLQPEDAELDLLNNYSGLEVTLERLGGANPADEYDLGSYQSGNTIIHTDGGGTVIGTVVKNNAGTLQLQFNNSATNTAVRDTLRSIGYHHSNAVSTATEIDLQWTIDDNNINGAQGPGGALSSSYVSRLQIAPAIFNAVDDDLGYQLAGESLSISPFENDTAKGNETTIISTTSPSIGSLTQNSTTLNYQSNTGDSGPISFDYFAMSGDADLISQWRLQADGSDDTGRNSGITNTDSTPGTLVFDGNDSIEIANFDYPDEFTLTFDFKINSLNNGNEETFYSQGDYEKANSLNVWVSGSHVSNPTVPNALYTDFRDSDNTGIVNHTFDISGMEGGGWHNYAIVVKEGVGASVYINGVEQGDSVTTAGAAPFEPTDPVYFGVENVSGTPEYHLINHEFRDVRILEGIDVAAINANKLNEFSTGTVSLTLRNEEMVVSNEKITVAEDTTVSISSTHLLTEDSFDNDPPSSIVYTIVDAADFGYLTLNDATLAQGDTFTQQDINTPDTIKYTHNGDETATTDRINLLVDDGLGTQTPITYELDLEPVNDLPQLSAIETNQLVYSEGDGAVSVTDNLVITDDDSNTLVSAAIQITSGYQPDEDSLVFADTANISGSYNATIGRLTLTATSSATISEWQSALRNVHYQNNSENPDLSQRIVSFEVNDGSNDSTIATRSIQLVAVNDSPTLSNTSLYSINEGNATPPGQIINDVIDGHFQDIDGTLAGIAVVGGESSSAGTWQYSTDSANTWSDINSVSTTAALTLSESSMIRFQPEAGVTGAAPQLEIFAIDDSYTGALTNSSQTMYADTTATASDSPYSLATAYIETIVLPVGPTDLSSGIKLNLDDGNDAYLLASDGGNLLGGLSALTIESQFSVAKANSFNTLLSYATAAQADSLLLGIDIDGTVVFNINGTRVETTQAYPQLLDGGKHQLAVSWESKNGDTHIFINGKPALTETAVQAGYIVPADGTLVLAQNQGATSAGFDTSQSLHGTYHDLRIWKDVQSATEIANNYQSKIDPTSFPDSLVANWHMDEFSNIGAITDIVSGSELTIAHAAGVGFMTSTPSHGLSVIESAGTGAEIGVLVPQTLYTEIDLIRDGTFLYSGDNATQRYDTGNFIGGNGGVWHVDSGNIEVLGNWATSPLGGKAVDLDGQTPGSISQSFATEPGKSYQVRFALTGNFGTPATQVLRVSAGATSTDFSVDPVDGWSSSNLLWAERSMTFVATSSTTTLAFASLSPTGNDGAVIGDVQVTQLADTIATVLATDPGLIYDGATSKFYLPVDSRLTWLTAQANANTEILNGVPGQLVTIYSDYENDIVHSIAQSLNSEVWIGATDRTTEESWRWQSGTVDGPLFWLGDETGAAQNGAYENWHPNEPNDDSIGEDYATLRNTNGQWNDLKYYNINPYIIEWDAQQVLSNLLFSLETNPADAFAIDENSGRLTVASAANLDFEQTQAHDVTVRITDIAGNYYDETFSIAIGDVTAPQLVNIESSALDYIENAGAMAISSTIEPALASNALIDSVVLQVTDGYAQGEDSLGFSNFDTFSGYWDSNTGTLTIISSNANADWQTALRSVTFENTSDNPSAGDRTVEIVATYFQETSNKVTREITLTSVNDAPLAGDQSYTILEDTSTALPLSAFNFTDPVEGHQLQAVQITNTTQHGSLLLNDVPVSNGQTIQATGIEDGQLVFEPEPDSSGASYDHLIFKVLDNGGTDQGGDNLSSNSGRLTIDITPINDRPTTVSTANPHAAVLEDNTIELDFQTIREAIGAEDVDGTIREFIVTSEHSGTLLIGPDFNSAAPFITDGNDGVNASRHAYWKPEENAFASSTPAFSIFAVDNDGAVSAAPEVFNIEVKPVNDAPIGNGSSLQLTSDKIYSFKTHEFGFTDPVEGDQLLSVRIASLPSSGQLHHNGSPVFIGQEISSISVSTGKLLYTPEPDNVSATSEFEFHVLDDGGTENGGSNLSTNASTMQLHITPANKSVDLPTDDLEFTVTENAPAGTVLGSLGAIDPDPIFKHIEDGNFDNAARPFPDFNRYEADGDSLGAEMGSWKVISGSVDLRGSHWEAGPAGGSPLDLNGDSAGAIEQRIKTTPGASYQLTFALSGNFRSTPLAGIVQLEASAGNQRFEFDYSPFTDWSEQNLQWQQKTAVFTATSSTTTIAFKSLTPGSFGPLISDVQVVDVLSYDLKNTSDPFKIDDTGTVLITDTTLNHEAQDSYLLDTSVSDFIGNSTFYSIPIKVLDINESPILSVNSTLQTIVGERQVIDATVLRAIDEDESDQAPESKIYTLINPTSEGKLLLNDNPLGTGDQFTQADINELRLSYFHDNAASARDHFTFEISDGGEDAALAHVDEFHISIHQALQLTDNEPLNLLEGDTSLLTTTQINTVGGYSIPDDLYIEIIGQPETVKILNTLRGVEISDFTLQDIIDNAIQVQHDGSEPRDGTIEIELYQTDTTVPAFIDSSSIKVNVIDIAEAPRGSDSHMTTDHATALTITVDQLGFDDGHDGDALKALGILGLPSNGTLLLQGSAIEAGEIIEIESVLAGQLQFQPDSSSVGSINDSISYRLIDTGDTASGGSNISEQIYTINLTIISDHPPQANSDQIIVDEGGTIQSLVGGALSVLDNDLDPDTPASGLSVKLTGAPLYGDLQLNTDGTFSYTHSGSETRSDSFSYRVIDSQPDLRQHLESTAVVEIEIVPTNDKPSANVIPDQHATVNEPIQIELPDNQFTDIDPDDELQLTATLTDGSALPQWLEFNARAGILSGQPDNSAAGILEIRITATDTAGETAHSTFELNIEPQFDSVLEEIIVTAPEEPPTGSEPERAAPAVEESKAEPEAPAPEIRPFPQEPSASAAKTAAETPPSFSDMPAHTAQVKADDFNDIVEKHNALRQRTLTAAAAIANDTALGDIGSEVNLKQLFFAPGNYTSSSAKSIIENLNQTRDQLDSDTRQQQVVLGSTLTLSTGLSLGYIFWLVRGGLLLGSVMSAMPAWKLVDPVPVLSEFDADDDDLHDDSLESMVTEEKQNAEAEAEAEAEENSTTMEGAEIPHDDQHRI